MERSGHYDAFDQGIAFFLPNQTWLQPPGQVHAMLAAHAQPNALPFDLSPTKWLATSAQLSDDASLLVVQLVHLQPGFYNSTVTLSLSGFEPGGVVDAWTLAVPADSPWGDQKTDGNTAGDPLHIAPVQSTLWWPAGAASWNVSVPAFSFTLLKIYAK